MIVQQTLTQLKNLSLEGMAHAFEEQITMPSSSALSFEDRFAMLHEQATCHETPQLEELLEDLRGARRLIESRLEPIGHQREVAVLARVDDAQAAPLPGLDEPPRLEPRHDALDRPRIHPVPRREVAHRRQVTAHRIPAPEDVEGELVLDGAGSRLGSHA